MRIKVGSKNPVKVGAVRDTLKDYELLRDSDISGIEVASGVSDQPRSLTEIVNGAVNRAKNAFSDCEYSFGIESGFVEVPGTKTGFMNVTACAIYNGTKCHLGLSSAFECPPVVTKMVLNEGMELDQAYYKAGLTDDRRLGYSGGVIKYLTRGRVTREDWIKESVRMALIHLENHELYES
jgi:inosine/xanthosine triphosphatase